MIYEVYKNTNGAIEVLGRTKSLTKATEYCQRMNEDWDDPTGAHYDFREVSNAD